MRACAGEDEAGARSRAGAGEAAFYDALTREGGEPAKMGKWTYQEGTRSSVELGRG